MVTYKTLETYRDKCKKALEAKMGELEKAKEKVKQLESDASAINGQIVTLETLMNIDENPPVVELPMAKDEQELEELYEKRLDPFEGRSEEEFYKDRQEATYKREAIDTIEAVDGFNRESSV